MTATQIGTLAGLVITFLTAVISLLGKAAVANEQARQAQTLSDHGTVINELKARVGPVAPAAASPQSPARRQCRAGYAAGVAWARPPDATV